MKEERCPGDMQDIRLIEVPIKTKHYGVCTNQMNASHTTGFNPSPEYCPTCPYNSQEIERGLRDEVSRRLKQARN